VVQALLDDLVKRGLDPSVPRLFLIDRAEALSMAIRRIFGRDTPIQRCPVHKARNILNRLPQPLHASTRRALRQAWDRDDAERAETLLCTLARTLQRGRGRGWGDPGRARCDPHRCSAGLTGGPAPLARLHHHHRDLHGLGAPRLPQRHALARRVHGAALDGRRHARGGQGFAQAEGQEPGAAAPHRSLGAPPESQPGLRGC
jgi:hypothetical protein